MRRMSPGSQTPTIRDAVRPDLPEILAIYNEVIRNSTAVYSEVEFTPARGETWFDTKAEQGFPFIVACDASGVRGKALAGPGVRASAKRNLSRRDCRLAQWRTVRCRV